MIYVSCTCEGMDLWIRIFTILIAVMIVLSTLTTKQHTLIDVLTAVPLFLISRVLGILLTVRYIIINGIICIETAIYMQRAFEVNCRKDVILSCFVVLGGIIMMFFSPNTVKVAAIMTGIIFIINAVIDGVILYRIHRISGQCAGKIQDAVDELSGNVIDEDEVK